MHMLKTFHVYNVEIGVLSNIVIRRSIDISMLI